MKNILFSIAAVLAFTTTVFSKEDTFKGYIITLQGKRMDGFIKTRNVTTDQMKITFEGVSYKPFEIEGYGYEEKGENQFGEAALQWRHYRSKKAVSFAPKAFASKDVFMEIMQEGEVTIYDYYVETPQDIENPYKRFFYMERKGANDWVEVSETNYVEIGKKYFEDNKDIVKQMGGVNYRFRNMWNIVKIYNDWKEMQNMAPAADYDTTKYSDTMPF